MTEGQLQDRIRIALGSVPGLVLWRNNVGKAQQQGRWVAYGVGGVGGADLIGLYHGRFVALEIKTGRGVVSADQDRFGDLVRKSGGEYAIV